MIVFSGYLKKDATFAGLSMSRLKLGISGILKDCSQDALAMDEFFLVAPSYFLEEVIHFH
jgi:hypothetical protein